MCGDPHKKIVRYDQYGDMSRVKFAHGNKHVPMDDVFYVHLPLIIILAKCLKSTIKIHHFGII